MKLFSQSLNSLMIHTESIRDLLKKFGQQIKNKILNLRIQNNSNLSKLMIKFLKINKRK